jgi:hypothetical protein
MNWHKVLLSKEEVRRGELHKIIKIFYDILKAYDKVRSANGVAMFEAIEKDTHYIYFTPASLKLPAIEDLVNIYSGLICGPPFRGSVSYVAGDVNYAIQFL